MKIGDFGMSRFVGADEIMTALGPQHLSRNLTVDVIGTAHYASPELLNDEVRPATRTSDRWLLDHPWFEEALDPHCMSACGPIWSSDLLVCTLPSFRDLVSRARCTLRLPAPQPA